MFVHTFVIMQPCMFMSLCVQALYSSCIICVCVLYIHCAHIIMLKKQKKNMNIVLVNFALI